MQHGNGSNINQNYRQSRNEKKEEEEKETKNIEASCFRD